MNSGDLESFMADEVFRYYIRALRMRPYPKWPKRSITAKKKLRHRIIRDVKTMVHYRDMVESSKDGMSRPPDAPSVNQMYFEQLRKRELNRHLHFGLI